MLELSGCRKIVTTGRAGYRLKAGAIRRELVLTGRLTSLPGSVLKRWHRHHVLKTWVPQLLSSDGGAITLRLVCLVERPGTNWEHWRVETVVAVGDLTEIALYSASVEDQIGETVSPLRLEPNEVASLLGSVEEWRKQRKRKPGTGNLFPFTEEYDDGGDYETGPDRDWNTPWRVGLPVRLARRYY